MGGSHSVENLIDRCHKVFFWTSTCARFLKHNSRRSPQTGVECMAYLSSAPHSRAVVDFATGCISAEAAEDILARHIHGRYPQQGCRLVEIPSHWAQLSKRSA